MNILDEMLRFPIIMIDMADEEKKEKLNQMINIEGSDPDIIIGEAMVPYWDFMSIVDRWKPISESIELAKGGEFDACLVQFVTAGQYLVPMPKKEFLKMYTDFEVNMPKKTIVKLTKKQITDLKNNGESI